MMGDLYSETLQVAAKMFGGEPGLLDASLCMHLDRAGERVRECTGNEGRLHSRQAISVLIECWQMHNPKAKPYHYGG